MLNNQINILTNQISELNNQVNILTNDNVNLF